MTFTHDLSEAVSQEEHPFLIADILDLAIRVLPRGITISLLQEDLSEVSKAIISHARHTEHLSQRRHRPWQEVHRV